MSATQESISQLNAATQANASDLIPATQMSIGPGTGTTRAITPAQVVAAPFPGTMTFTHAPVTDTTAPGTGYLIQQSLAYNLSVTCSGIFFGNEFNATVNGNPPSGAQIWNNFDRIFCETAPTSGADIVNRYIQTIRPATFGTPAQIMWGVVMELRDQTGLKSSLAGGILGLEIDIACNDLDDAGTRQGLVITFLNGTGSGVAPQANEAIGIFSGGMAAANFKSIIQMAAPFHDAGIDMRNMGRVSGGTTHAIWFNTGLDIAFDTAGAVTLSTDTTYINASVMVNSPRGYAIGGSAQLLSADGSTMATSVPFRLQHYTTAALPVLSAPEQGSLAFCVDGRNPGEGSGSGSGCLAILNHAGTWVAVWSGVAVTV